MSAWAKPGVKVVCIADAIGSVKSMGFPLFKKGQIFTIAFVDECSYGKFLGFVEEHPLHTGHINGFRPLVTKTQEDDLAIFLPLLTDLRVREPS